MPIFESHVPGSPCWVDFQSTDVEAATKFYQAVFYWQVEPQFDDQGNQVYTMFKLNGANVCGGGAMPPGAQGRPSTWNTYIRVLDVGKAAQDVIEAGGTVAMPPMEVMDSGKMAVFLDPTGAAFCAWEPHKHQGAQICNEPNTWSWSEHLSDDPETATAFYGRLFGWTYDEQDMGPIGTYRVIEGGENGGWGGFMNMPPEVCGLAPNHWMVYFTVSNTDETIALVKDNGGTVLEDPMVVPGVGTIAVLADPTGAAFSTLQPELPAD
ncbi:MAG: VOC family protein [Acidimicrobiia bacterium]|jgi:predicted enzyme related to lactoylglutathione lyase|nr:VOC family protein [Acidimicrobiia bacterium]MBP8181041.1 VOC family protein [Acidimicrobiia bacterium]